MIDRSKYQFALDFKVRDYECDLQGIVNNAIYQNYMEHTRHEFITILGLDFSDLHDRGIDVMVARIEIAYKSSLRSGDEFVSCVDVHLDGIKYIFNQAIYNKKDGKLVITGKVTTVATIDGRLGLCKEVTKAIESI
jgi:acyl-CoA thioester hydrolase